MDRLETSITRNDAYRMLLADEIAIALTSGASVIATGPGNGPGGASDVLDLVAAELAEAGIRSLSLRPPLDAASFAAQFADGWRSAARGAAMPAAGSTEKFAILVHEAHNLPPGALRHLDRLAATWPGMQLAFAGLPGAAGLIRSADYPALAERASKAIDIAAPKLRLALTPVPSSHPPRLEAAKPAIPAIPLPPATAPKTAPRRRHGRRGSASIVTALGAACISTGILVTPAAIPAHYGAAGLDWWRARLPSAAAAAPRPDTPERQAEAPADSPPVLPVLTQSLPPLAPTPAVAAPEPVAARPSDSTSLAAPPPKQSAEAAAPKLDLPPVNTPADEPAVEASTQAPAPSPPQQAEPPQAEPPPPEPVTIALADIRPPAPPAAPPAPQPVLARPAPPPDPAALAMADSMTRRGRAMLEIGDVSAARLLLERAAAAGSGPAALAMGTTFDPATLSRLGTMGVQPNPAQAAQWYRLALSRGEPQARAMLDALPPGTDIPKSKSPP